MAKLTKSVVFDTDRDADLLDWIADHRANFTTVVRDILYAAMKMDTGQPPTPTLDLASIRQIIREELAGLAIVEGESAASPPLQETEVGEDLRTKLLAF